MFFGLGRLGAGFGGLGSVRNSTTAVAAILLTGSDVAENASVGALVGTLSVVNATGTPVFALDASAGGKFALDGADIEVGGALDYETATSHEITVSVTGTTPAISPRTLTIAVTNVLEVTLAALALSASTVAEDAAVATVVGAIQNGSSGSTITLADSAGGLFAISGGNIVTAGALDYETATSHNITLRETHVEGSNSPRDTVLAITVTDVSEGVGATPMMRFNVAANSQLLAVLDDF